MGSSSAKLSAGQGTSVVESTKDAVAEAIKKASEGISGTPSIAFISCTVSRDVEEVRAEFSKQLDCPISGITSSGGLLAKNGSHGNSVGCLLVKSSNKGSFATSYDAKSGEDAVKGLKDKMKKPQVILMFATPGAEEGIIEKLHETFPDVPVFGGTAADDALAGEWRVMSKDSSSETGVSLVGVAGDVKVGASMLGPYTATDKKVVATKTEGRRVFEIDGKPAADWALEWIGDDVKEQYEKGGLVLPQTAQSPLGIKQASGEYVTNHLAAFGGEEKFIDFFAPIVQGSELVVMDSGDGPSTGYGSTFEKAYDVALTQGSMAGSSPVAGLLIFCGGMAIAVGDHLDKGLSNEGFVSKIDSLPILGTTCFGEQGQLPEAKTNVQRNLSCGMILLG
mmetsp:Transcript_21089/g.25856  ORF Transcript_21089/g.25856 Transcript_21089/m.25856 type:complete len:393 (-) Transcript_21089:205-1383(-)